MRLITYKYRLYPTNVQDKRLRLCLKAARGWYNMCLAERKYAWEVEQRTVGVYDQLALVKHFKVSFRQFRAVHSHILQVATADCDKAFKAFFRRVKAGETPGYPRFKGAAHFHSFGFKEYGNGFRVDGRRLKLSGIGRVAVRWHRALEGTVKTARVMLKANVWYVCFVCEVPDPAALPTTGHVVGVDVGVQALLTTSDGNKVDNPRWYRNSQRDLRIAQRALQRKPKGSRNRKKALLKVQRRHEHVKAQREDMINKLVHRLIAENDLIAIEDLAIRNMVQNRKLAKSILDAGWGYFKQRLLSKAANAGREVVLVNPAYTSKTCSACGAVFEHLTLADRWVTCDCGLSLDRDHNAAINILKRTGQDVSVLHNVGREVMRAVEATRLQPV